MLVTTTNKLIGVTPTILTDAGVAQTPANISDPDHSNTYTSGTSTGPFTISFGAQTGISYVAISGHNAVAGSDASIEVNDNGTTVETITISRNHNLFFSFAVRSFTDLRIIFTVTPNIQQTTVSYIAAGTYLAIPRGEQSGYSRQWLKRHTTSRASTNLMVGPTGVIQKKVALKGSLSIPNQTIDFAETFWQNFMDFSYDQPFFIKEDDAKAESSYICYDPKHDIKAHSDTRLLVNPTMKFTCFNGL